MNTNDIYVFDAYGTLFDVDHACKEMEAKLGNNWVDLSALWRQKQLEYSWLYNSLDLYISFWKITEDSLDYSLEKLNLNSNKLRNDLLELYFKIASFKEVKNFLNVLYKNKIKTAILSNGSYDMLNAAVQNSKLENLLSEIISVDDCKKFKPHQDVYNLILKKFDVLPSNVIFFSSNCWDIHGASNFGFKTVWINRKKNINEKLPGKISLQLNSLIEYLSKD